MNNTAEETNEILSRSRDLVASLEAGNNAEAERIMDELTQVRETALFVELGKLTRQLHDTLGEFNVSDIAQREIPDARERLNHVITMTEESAHTTLAAVEKGLPIAESIEHEARGVQQDMASSDQDMTAFLESTINGAGALQEHLNKVLMAQTYQDLTGQIISRVITLVQDVELGLVGLIRLAGAGLSVDEVDDENSTGHGPAVPGVDTEGRVDSQDEVDDLLSSLGF